MELPHLEVGPSVDHDGEEVCRIEFRCPPSESLGRLRIPLEHERDGRIDEHLWRQRIQFDRACALGDRFLEPSLEGQRHAELIVRERVIGVERKRTPEFALASSQVVFVEQLEHGCSRRCSVSPAMYSITRNSASPSSPISKILQMYG